MGTNLKKLIKNFGSRRKFKSYRNPWRKIINYTKNVYYKLAVML